MKNVILNGKTYTGVSTLDLTDTGGETVVFQDVDEVSKPTGSLEVTENGTYDISGYASVIINVPVEVSEVTINKDETTAIELAHNTEYRRSEVTELTLTLPENIPDALDCMVCFTSGATATTVTMPDGVVMQGDAVSNGVFVPKAGHRYDLIFWFDGAKVWCTICAVSLSDNTGDEEEPVVPTAYTLTISQGTGVGSVTVTKTSGYGALGTLNSGSTVYEGDVLSVSATAASGYTLDSYTKTVTVSGNVTVSVTATANSSGDDDSGDTKQDGSEAHPYLISTAAELVALGAEVDAVAAPAKSGVYYALANDIDLAGIDWNPIGANGKDNATLYPDASSGFAGTLDGRGHTISNLTVGGELLYGGLFGSNFTGTVINLGIVSGAIDLTVTKSSCGAIARKGTGKIINCYSRVACSATARSAGIIDEIGNGAMVLGCYQAAVVTPNGTGAYAIKAATTTTGTIKYCLWDSSLTEDGINGSSSSYANNSGITTAEFATAHETLNANLAAVATEAGVAESKLCKWEAGSDGYPRLVVA